MSQYKTGTVAVTVTDATVTGTGTLWVANAAAGQTFMIAGSAVPYIIGSVTDDTHLELSAPYAGATTSGLSYEINTSRTPTLLLDYMEQGDLDTATTFKRAMLQIEALLTVAGAGWTPRLSKSVAGSADVTLTAAEAGNLILNFTGALTGNINVIVPTAARMWIVDNATTGAYTLTVKTSAGTGIAVAQGMVAILECNATNVVAAITALPGNIAIAGTLKTATTIGVGAATPAATGAGITFPVTQSASSDPNTFDDYEEGTWTPTDASGASLTFTAAGGTYVKKGREVTVCQRVTYPATADASNSLIGGLPFSASNDFSSQVIYGGHSTVSTIDTQYGVYSTNVYLYQTSSGTRYTNVNNSAKLRNGICIFFT